MGLGRFWNWRHILNKLSKRSLGVATYQIPRLYACLMVPAFVTHVTNAWDYLWPQRHNMGIVGRIQ